MPPVVLKLRDHRPKTARLAIADEELPIDNEGRIIVPEIGLHDVLVVRVE